MDIQNKDFTTPSALVKKGLMAALTIALLGALAIPAAAQLPNPFLGSWQAEGPAPVSFAQVENVTPNDEVSGAIHTVAAHPTNPDVLVVGTVNGGIWLTTNASALQPTWTNLNRRFRSLSIGALEFDPTVSGNRSLVAGVGLWSSFGRIGGRRIGLLRTFNGGRSWKVLNGGGLLTGLNVSGVAPRGKRIALSADTSDTFVPSNPATYNTVGIFASVDAGATFSQISGAPGSGLPLGVTFDLAGDPTSIKRLFTSVVFAQGGGQNGIYRSIDAGITWTKVSNAAIDAQLNAIVSTNANVEIAAGNHRNVYAAIANNGRLQAVFRSGDHGNTWTQMGLPGTTELAGFFGVHPGGQASIHMSIVADPTDANIVYIGGDRQPFASEGLPSGPFFPNSIGANNFTGRLFRGDASQPLGSQWVHLTHSDSLGALGGGTASNSAPHADSREMVFNAGGDLIETDDGGIYRRTNPRDNTGDWFSLNGNLQVTEIHDHDFDNLPEVLHAGNQDNGTTVQDLPGTLSWQLLLSGDGGDAVTAAGGGVRYNSAQNLGNFVLTTWDAANNLTAVSFPPLIVIGGGAAIVPQFVTPVEPHATDPLRVLIGGANSLYESSDQATTVTEIGPGIFAVGDGRDPISYGSPGNPDVIYAANFDGIVVRTGPPGSPLLPRPSFPGTGSGLTIRDIVIDPDDWQTAYVINAQAVYSTNDAGLTWTDLSGVLPVKTLTPFRSITYAPRVDGAVTDDLLVVGVSDGIVGSTEAGGFTNWGRLGRGFPAVPVFDLDYDAATETLSAGTLGRGAFSAVNIVSSSSP